MLSGSRMEVVLIGSGTKGIIRISGAVCQADLIEAITPSVTKIDRLPLQSVQIRVSHSPAAVIILHLPADPSQPLANATVEASFKRERVDAEGLWRPLKIIAILAFLKDMCMDR
jgi:hypothetical protein